MQKLILFAGILAFSAAPALAAPCRDANGKFIKCAGAEKPAAKPADNIVKDKNGKCHYASGPNKGKFTKC